MKTNSGKALEIKITPCDGNIEPVHDSCTQTSSAKHPASGEVRIQVPKDPGNPPNDLSRFMAYAG